MAYERTTTTEMWTYGDRSTLGADLAEGFDVTGYKVEAIDGSIGKIDETTRDVGSSYLVIDTGPWIFGKKVMLPAGVVERVDVDDETVFVNRTKDEIKDAPEFDEGRYRDEAYRDELGGYYGSRTVGSRQERSS